MNDDFAGLPGTWRDIAKAPGAGGEETAERAGEAAERASEGLREAVGHGLGHGHGGHGKGGHGGKKPAAGHGGGHGGGHPLAPSGHAAAGGGHADGGGGHAEGHGGHAAAAKKPKGGGDGRARDERGRFTSKAWKRAAARAFKSFEGAWGAPMPMYDQQTAEQNDFELARSQKADLPAAAICIVRDAQGRVLCVSRPEPPHELAIPGGLVDPGETPDVAAIRELAEECGVTIDGVESLGDTTSPTDGRTVYVYEATGWRGDPSALESGTSIGWLTPQELLAQAQLYRATVRELMSAGVLKAFGNYPEMVASGGEVLSTIGETDADDPDYGVDGGNNLQAPPPGDYESGDPTIFDQPQQIVVTASAKDDAGTNAGGDGFDDHPWGEPRMFDDAGVVDGEDWIAARAKAAYDAVQRMIDKAFFVVPGVTGRPTPEDEVAKRRVRKQDGPGQAVNFRGIPVIVDRPKGYVQRGTAADGSLWERTYLFDYGYIPGTCGGDGDSLDVYLGPCPESPFVTWCVQLDGQTGGFDEYKVFLGFPSLEAAIEAYAAHTPIELLGAAFMTDLGAISALLGQDPRAVIETLKATHVEAAMAIKVRKDGMPDGPGGQPNGDEVPVGGGGADIVAIAADRLNDITSAIEAAGGVVTPDIGESIESVCALLEAVSPLDDMDDDDEMDENAGDELPAGPGEPTAMSDEAKRAETAKLWKAGKLCLVGKFETVKMSPEAFVTKLARLMKRAHVTKNEALRKMRQAAVQKMLTYGPEVFGSDAGFQMTGTDQPAIPMYSESMVEVHPTEETTPSEEPVKSQFSYDPTYTPNANSQQQYDAGSPQFVEKSAQRLGAVAAKLRPMLQGVTKAGPAGDANGAGGGGAADPDLNKGEGPNTEKGTWTTAYVNDLPDSSFLYVEPGGSKDEGGLTTPRTLRHFPYKDAQGNVDLPHLRDAAGRIPQSGIPDSKKKELQAEAQKLLASHEDQAKSDLAKADRGDDGWPADLAAPDFLAGGKPKGTLLFGRDNIVEKSKRPRAQTTRQASR